MANNKSIGSLTIQTTVIPDGVKKGLFKVEQSIKAAVPRFKRSFSPLQKTFTDMRNMAVGIFGVAAITQAVRYFDTIDKGVRRMNVSISNARKNANDYGKIAKDIYGKMPVSIEQATSAITALANRTKLTGEAFKAASEQAAALNALSGGNDATQATLVAMRKWGVEGENFKQFSDILYSVSKEAGLGAAGVQEIATALASADDSLGRFGLTVEQSAALIGGLKTEGEDVASVISAMEKAVLNLSKRGLQGGMVAGWEKINREMSSAATYSEKIQVATKYFGSKQAVPMVGVFENISKYLSISKDSMSSVVDDLKETATPLDEMLKKLERIALVADRFSRMFDPAGEFNKIMRNVDNKGAGRARLGVGAEKAGNIKTPYRELDLGTITRYSSATVEAAASTGTLGVKLADAGNSARWTKQSLEDLFGELPTFEESVKSLSGSFSDTLTDGFMSIISGTEKVSDAFRNMAANIVSSIAKIVMQQTISQPIAGALINMLGGFGNMSFGGFSTPNGLGLGSVPINAAAGGGYAPANEPLIVGENGAEMIFPTKPVSVLSNHDLSSIRGNGGGSVVVNQYNTFSGGNSNEIQKALKDSENRIAMIIADRMNRGGTLGAALRA